MANFNRQSKVNRSRDAARDKTDTREYTSGFSMRVNLKLLEVSHNLVLSDKIFVILDEVIFCFFLLLLMGFFKNFSLQLHAQSTRWRRLKRPETL